MKKILVCILFVGLALVSAAQDKPTFVSLNAGIPIPVGDFHSKELPDGGFALAGFSSSLEGAWFFKPWLGIGGNAGFNLSPVDVETLGYEKALDDPFIDEAFVRSDPYFISSFYAGLFFNVPLVQKLSFTGKATGGLIYAATPYQLYKADYYLIGMKWFEVTSAEDFEASFLVGAGLRYDLNNCLGFALNSDFTYNNCEFDFVTANNEIRTDQKVISFINVSLGLVIKL
jgi:hypothetical protein